MDFSKVDHIILVHSDCMVVYYERPYLPTLRYPPILP